MKNVLAVILAVVALVTTGCVGPFKKKPAQAVPPAPPPITTVGQPPATVTISNEAVQPQQSAQPTATAPQGQRAALLPGRPVIHRGRTQWLPVSVFENVFDTTPGPHVSAKSITLTNMLENRFAIQAGDKLAGIRDENGQLGVVIVPPGESFTLHDPGLGSTIVLKAVIIDASNKRIGYIGRSIGWNGFADPRRYMELTTHWDITKDLTMVPLPGGDVQSAQPPLPTLGPIMSAPTK